MRFVPALAVVAAGLALYVSRGVVDQIVTPAGPVRVAMLPPAPLMGGFFAIGVLGLLWLDRRAVPRASATAVRPPLGPLLLPLFALLLLVVPYLPLLPDWVPALQIVAGPLRTLVWLAVGAQLFWVLWQTRLIRAEWLQHASLRQLAIAIGVLTVLVTGAGAMRLTGTVLYPAGDEPHYLVIAQSLWRDGDLKIENNHTRGDYREYFSRSLDPHYLTRGADGEIYSIHPVGMPVLMAPVYAVAGYPGVVATFVLMAAVAAAMMWTLVLVLTNSGGAATFAWAAVAATAPFLFNAFAVYPEIPAALAVVTAFAFITVPPLHGAGRWLTIGAACALLPWLSTKYAPMSAALILVALLRAWSARGRSTWLAMGAIVIPYGLSLLAWFAFFYSIWGSPLPQAPYGALVQTDVKNLVFGAPGLLFDQEYGLLPYAPVYLLAATGLWAMWRGGPESRRLMIEVAVVFGALLGTVGAFRIWWGGSASPGRPLVSGLLLLALPVAYAFRAAPAGSARRAAQHLLLWTSIGIAGVLLFAQQGLLTANGRDGTSALLEYLSPRWAAWTLVPSFIHHEAWTALAHTGVWMALVVAAAVWLARARATHPGRASLTALMVATATLVAAAIVMPAMPLSPEWPALDLRARPRLPLLDRFDSRARPLAFEYTPMRRVSPADLATRATLEVEPGLRTQPQPIRVLHNGRFSLPAGTYRVEVEWGDTRSGDSIGLQLGRTGDPWQTWPVDARSGERWTTEFDIPFDMSFVGLRGSPELERAIKSIRIHPLAVVSVSDRPRAPEVIAASRSGPASIYYYDHVAFPEKRGFWTWGGRRTRVTIHRPDAAVPLTLRVHSGPVANRLRASTFGWHETVALQPEAPILLELPPSATSLVTLDLESDEAFVPRERDPASTDQRTLGVWVEVVQ